MKPSVSNFYLRNRESQLPIYLWSLVLALIIVMAILMVTGYQPELDSWLQKANQVAK